MAKMAEVSQAELEYMTSTIAHDGILIAKMTAELEAAKRDIHDLLVACGNRQACDYCKKNPQFNACEFVNECEKHAEWRGWHGDFV